MMRTIGIVVPLLLLLPVLCEQLINLRTNFFIHYTQMLQWSDAQAYCRKYHTDLVTITSEKENQNFLIGQGWIGLYRDSSSSSWQWSRTRETATFTNWDVNEPIQNNNCAFKYNNTLKWNTGSCTSTHTFMCYDEMLLVKENKTWEEALSYCRALEAVDPTKPATDYNNYYYDLVTVMTQDDYNNIREKIVDATTNEVWTSLRYLAGQWVWVGGEEVQSEVIQSCPAQEFCGVLVKENATIPVKTGNCQLGLNFVCYMKPSPGGGT